VNVKRFDFHLNPGHHRAANGSAAWESLLRDTKSAFVWEIKVDHISHYGTCGLQDRHVDGTIQPRKVDKSICIVPFCLVFVIDDCIREALVVY